MRWSPYQDEAYWIDEHFALFPVKNCRGESRWLERYKALWHRTQIKGLGYILVMFIDTDEDAALANKIVKGEKSFGDVPFQNGRRSHA